MTEGRRKRGGTTGEVGVKEGKERRQGEKVEERMREKEKTHCSSRSHNAVDQPELNLTRRSLLHILRRLDLKNRTSEEEHETLVDRVEDVGVG